MLLMIDNYDSFTYNVAQYLGELGAEVKVYRNDAISIEEIESLEPQQIVISPGPCTPNEAGISMQVISHFAGKKPILGICLGHQSIGQAFGGKIVRAGKVMHGKLSSIQHDGKGVFKHHSEYGICLSSCKSEKTAFEMQSSYRKASHFQFGS